MAKSSLQFHDYSTISVDILQNVHFIVSVSRGTLHHKKPAPATDFEPFEPGLWNEIS